MRTGLTKKQKTTVIYFDEHSRIIEVQTHNTDLKKRLTAFAAKHPQCCRQTGDDEQGGLTFEIEKGRLSFRLTAPYMCEFLFFSLQSPHLCNMKAKWVSERSVWMLRSDALLRYNFFYSGDNDYRNSVVSFCNTALLFD